MRRGKWGPKRTHYGWKPKRWTNVQRAAYLRGIHIRLCRHSHEKCALVPGGPCYEDVAEAHGVRLPQVLPGADTMICSNCKGAIVDMTLFATDPLTVTLEVYPTSATTRAGQHVSYSDGPALPTVYYTSLKVHPIRIYLHCKCGHKHEVSPNLFSIDWAPKY